MSSNGDGGAANHAGLLAAATHLARKYVDAWPLCEAVALKGGGRCAGAPEAVRCWEDGLPDVVCRQHGLRAEERGALVIWTTRSEAD